MLCTPPTKDDVFRFLQNPVHMHGTLAYLGADGHPDTALVAFSATPSLEIIFGTSDQSRKFGCLTADARVGFNVTDVNYRLTIQLTGRARELCEREMDRLKADHYQKLGAASERFHGLPGQHFYTISPIEVRFTNCVQEPWETTVF
jgi:hypothetical protein